MPSEHWTVRETSGECRIVHRQLKPPSHNLDKKSGRIHDGEGVNIHSLAFPTSSLYPTSTKYEYNAWNARKAVKTEQKSDGMKAVKQSQQHTIECVRSVQGTFDDRPNCILDPDVQGNLDKDLDKYGRYNLKQYSPIEQLWTRKTNRIYFSWLDGTANWNARDQRGGLAIGCGCNSEGGYNSLNQSLGRLTNMVIDEGIRLGDCGSRFRNWSCRWWQQQQRRLLGKSKTITVNKFRISADEAF
ncbi:hypothetical protein BDR03DRAFT_983993 [Suillus americanus]|nr:hypothetical protein BDR03DRAFT_983993 [Suillus americanus]